jgi:hypothetical protein
LRVELFGEIACCSALDAGKHFVPTKWRVSTTAMDELEPFCMSFFDELNTQLCIQRPAEATFHLTDHSLSANDSPTARQDRICQASESQ